MWITSILYRSASTTQEPTREESKNDTAPKEDDKDTKKKQPDRRSLREEEKHKDEEVNDGLGEEEKENVNKQALQKTSDDAVKIQAQSLTVNDSDYAYTIITEAHLKALMEYVRFCCWYFFFLNWIIIACFQAELVRQNKSKYESKYSFDFQFLSKWVPSSFFEICILVKTEANINLKYCWTGKKMTSKQFSNVL